MATTAEPHTTAFEAFEAAGWQRRARGYEAFFRAVTARCVSPVLDAVRAGPGIRLLDVATGPGDVAGIAVERGASATGVDIAEAMIAIARPSWPEVDFRTADAHALPFPDGSFDAATVNFGILHFGRPEQAARELVRVLAPGGRLAVTVWDRPEGTALFSAVLEALDSCDARPPDDIPEGPPFFRFSDDGELRALLEGAGLGSVEITTLRFTHPVRSAHEAWRGVVDGSVRTAALILGQPESTQRRIHRAFATILERHRTGDVLVLPTAVKLAVGEREVTP